MWRFVNILFYLYLAKEENIFGKNFDWLRSDPFAIGNTALFALTNGFCTTAFFVLGPEKVKEDTKKEVAGFLNILGLLSGIFTGTLAALIFKDFK